VLVGDAAEITRQVPEARAVSRPGQILAGP
jgi:hypothetical protein